MIRTIPALLALAATLSAQVSFVHLGTLDVASTAGAANPEFIGSNPSAVAWNGTDVWVAGFNSSGAVGTAAIVKVANALTTPTFGTAFGVQAATPNSRGYSGLDISGGVLAAAYDDGGVHPQGITLWDTAGNSLWDKAGRGSSGVAHDPGFVGADAGVGWITFGSGRRQLQDSVTGGDVYTTVNGMIVDATPPTTTLWRDMDFDEATGNIYLRKSNLVVSALRVGGNLVALNQVLVAPTVADLINLQTIAFVPNQYDPFVIWNDRSSGGGGQAFADVIKASRTSDGTPLSIDWGAFTAPNGAGAYDFSYDGASGTLAISDYIDRKVHVFAVTVSLGFGVGCPGQGGVTPQLGVYGDARPSGALTYTASSLAPLSIGMFAFGGLTTTLPLPFPGSCPLHVLDSSGGTAGLFIGGLFVTGTGAAGSGSGQFVLPLPAVALGIDLAAQAIVLENGSLGSLVTSAGRLVWLP